ncbi:class I SAM-dependent DNA methyltransferase [Clostridium tetani]|uniref:class I SAM-dependent DNA methyltransferase n=1 Tax=Clostridium tetani TaxID=1513 RepID=UPI0003C0CF82|nr:class I SAM-dependent methyltransferase [Clostridium tetani]CDI50479.1 methyltransferase [Clostridium tetani 12124569]
MECYKDFAQIYDNLIKEDIDYHSWSNFIMDIVNIHNVKKDNYLDLACGTGNITEIISKHFKTTWAVDLSSNMLAEAEMKLRYNGIKGNFVKQDISKLELGNEFNLITCCLDSINYLTSTEDVESYFLRVYNHLKDGGIFIFDINSYYKITEVLGNNTYTYDSEEVFYTWENYLDKDIVEMYLTFFIKKANDYYERFDEVHRERAYKMEWLEKLIKKNNFKIIDKFNGYELKAIEEKSERIVYVLKK